MQIIPLIPSPNRVIRADLDGYTVSIDLHWQTKAQQWFIDLNCDQVGLHYNGFALVTGTDMLKSRTTLLLGALILIDSEGNSDPDFDGLGTRWILIYLSRSEVDALG